jgi:hypothetical protein
MTPPIDDLLRDISKVDQADLLSAWRWRLPGPMDIVMISNLGDLFLQDQHGHFYWLQTDGGELEKIAETSDQFTELLNDEETLDNWLLPALVEKLIAAGQMLKDNEVYSPKKMAVLGGIYDIDNFWPTDMSVHFQFTGVICEQIKDLPDGTPVNIRVVP